MRFLDRLWLAAIFICLVAAGLPIPVQAQTQYFTEFELAPHPIIPYAITAGSDGALWFTQVETSNSIGRISTTGHITGFNPRATSSFLTSIVTGPDGALWFANSGGGQIGRITTDGASTLYSLGNGNSKPQTITSGPDGALWFTEVGCSTCSPAAPGGIGRITTTGIVTQYQIMSSALSAPFGIALGSDGALWFTEFGCSTCNPLVPSKIGRITADGAISEFSLPANRWAGNITAGPDGALWFLEANTSTATTRYEMGRITTAGAFTEFPLNLTPIYFAAGYGELGALTTDNVRNVLVYDGSGTAGDAIGYVSTAGVETDYAMPNAAAGLAIVTGPDGATWFTGYGSDVIGRFGAPASTLVAAVLPSSRSVSLSQNATAFATLINGGTTEVTNCSIRPNLAEGFNYQTTDSTTNAAVGTANTPVNIPAGHAQSFVISFTAQMAGSGYGPAVVPFQFSCDNGAAAILPGINTLLLSQSPTATPDVVALAGTTSNDGILHIPGSGMTGAFAVATVNLGSGDSITVSANTGNAIVPVSLSICQTNPVTAACLSPPGPTAQVTIPTNAMPTFSIFAKATGNVPFDPAGSRLFVQFADSNGVVRGLTSVAVETQ